MATGNYRVVIPTKPDDILTLSNNIIAKHTTDGATSPLQLIDMDDFAAKVAAVTPIHLRVEELRRQSEIATEQRNLLLGIQRGQTLKTPGTLYFYVGAIRTMLQGLYYGQARKLGDWGFTVDSGGQAFQGKVQLRRNADFLLKLCGLILAKHTADGVDSPLQAFDITDMGDKYTQAQSLHDQALQIRRDVEKNAEQRNQIMGIAPKQSRRAKGLLLFYIASARTVLAGIYTGNEQTLGDWGFEVNTTVSGGGDGEAENGGEDV